MRAVAERAETDPCEKGTPGCCIDHSREQADPDIFDEGGDGSCETW